MLEGDALPGVGAYLEHAAEDGAAVGCFFDVDEIAREHVIARSAPTAINISPGGTERDTAAGRDLQVVIARDAHPHTEIRRTHVHAFNPFASRSIFRVMGTSGPSRNNAP